MSTLALGLLFFVDVGSCFGLSFFFFFFSFFLAVDGDGSVNFSYCSESVRMVHSDMFPATLSNNLLRRPVSVPGTDGPL